METSNPSALHQRKHTAWGKTHSLSEEGAEVVASLTDWMGDEIVPLLKDPNTNWQPGDFLPDSSSEDFLPRVADLRARASGLSDDLLVCLVGDMISEEALPTYLTMINTLDVTRDETGASDTPWAIWGRGWAAEENRHGDLLNQYLYLTGRVDMKAVQRTTQYLVGSGMDPKTENNPYLGFIYTSFQERATFVSHGATARLAVAAGDEVLARICGTIAADERRHETAYKRIVGRCFECDPNGAILAFGDMMKKQITMPAHNMFDGQSDSLFKDYSEVAQRIGVYTARDYSDIVAHLVKYWKVANRSGLSPEAEKMQDYLCRLPDRLNALSERMLRKSEKEKQDPARFSWVFNRV